MSKVYLKIVDKLFSIPAGYNMVINHKAMSDASAKKAIGISPTIFLDAPNSYFNLPIGMYRMTHLLQYRPNQTFTQTIGHFDTEFNLNVNGVSQTPFPFKMPITSNKLETTINWSFTFEVKNLTDQVYFQWVPKVYSSPNEGLRANISFDLRYTTFELESIDFD